MPQRQNLALGRLVVFRLDGKAAYPRIGTDLPPVPPPPEIAGVTPALVAHGAVEFNQYCAACHGFGAISGHVTPDLRRSGFIQDPDAFASVVKDGALLSQGMPRFGDAIADADREAIRAFLAHEAGFLYALQNGAAPVSAPVSGEKPALTGGQ